jgi:16S rRNA (guanine966-N2)-methyltransferase
VRESLFNVLAARLDFTGMSVLDLYAGSGALGLEALSRGAAGAVFVEANQRAAAVISQNVRALGLPGATVRCSAVDTALAAGTSTPVDLIFADPPYEVDTAELERMVGLLAEKGWATPGTVLVVERPKASALLRWPSGWQAWRDRSYGDTRVEMAERGEGE